MDEPLICKRRSKFNYNSLKLIVRTEVLLTFIKHKCVYCRKIKARTFSQKLAYALVFMKYN